MQIFVSASYLILFDLFVVKIVSQIVSRPNDFNIFGPVIADNNMNSGASRLNDYVGKDIRIERLESVAVQENRRVTHGSELECDLDKQDESKCCWLNWPSSSPKLVPWIPVSGAVKPEYLGESVINATLPSGKYFLAASKQPSSAELVSCTLDCSDYDIDVSFKYWASSGVKLEVCVRSVEAFDTLALCHIPTVDKKTRRVDATFPAAEYVNIVIKVTLPSRSMTIIDDISVNALPCSTSTTALTTTTIQELTTTVLPVTTTMELVTTPSDEQLRRIACQSVECNFEVGMCQYRNVEHGSTRGINRKWKIIDDAYTTKIRGLKGPGSGRQYVAAYLLPSDTAAIETPTSFDRNLVIRFLVFKALEGIDLRGCCSNLTYCPYSTENHLDVADYGKWNEANFMCPPETSKTIFYGYNLGESPGAIAMDKVRLFIPHGPVPRTAYLSACQTEV